MGSALLSGALIAVVALMLGGQNSDGPMLAVVLGCVGALSGAVAGAGREIALAVRERPTS